ncbi:isoamylase early set domain-containing protein [Reichenbachiella versicolor]|uniref:isoamylase early set domain-containing protein n=1 Tax=Reichenbachiella versicolor TaxID=1821036 RepID=UPI000D6DE4DC|nr:isoamylase early set domain-containing protein [Reichenbachiella versicolor]
MSIKKQFLKSKDLYKVTWNIDKKIADGAESIALAGDFNGWNETTDQFTKMKSGGFKITLELPKEKQYQFRYLVDGTTWVNEKECDGYTPNEFAEENCVLSL